MKKFNLLLILLACIAFRPAKAQVDTAALINAYYTSDFIFEGVVQEQCYYDDPQTGNIYTSNKIQITKIFKGNLVCGTINLITPGGQLNGYEIHVSHQTEFNVGVAGVFLCKNTVYPESTCGFITDNTQTVELTEAFQGTIEYLFDHVNAEVEGFNSQFPTIESFYDFLTINGINMIDCNNLLIVQMRKAAYTSKVLTENVLERAPTPYSADRIIPKSKAHLLDRKQKADHSLLSGNLEFVISNISLSGLGCNKEYVIQVAVKSNVSNTYLQGVLFRLKYNTLALGTNVYSSITFNRTSDFPASTYDFIGGFDYTSSIVQFSMQSTVSNPSFTQITATPKPLFTIHIPVSNCKQLGNFVIDTFSNNLLTFHSLSPTSMDYLDYDNLIYGASDVGSLCDPVILSLSNTSFHAGRGETLTIDGCNFGTTKGNIQMNNADASPTSIAVDKYDIIQWNDNQIKIRIPSQVDSGHVSGTTYKKHSVGTGPVMIIDAYGGVETTNPILIKSSVWNHSKVYSSNGFAKTNRFLFSANSDGLYHFKLHPNITNPEMIDCIKAAIRRWRCTTHVPFVLDAGTYTANADSDGVNIIKLTSLGTSSNAQTWMRTVSNCSTNPSIPFPSNEMDIEINLDRIQYFQYDTTGNENLQQDSTDFFRTIMHELGHALCLNHTLNTQDIMYYAGIPGFVNASNRSIYIKNNDLDAANYIVNNSTNTPSGMSCTFNLPIQLQTSPCAWNNSVGELLNNQIGVSVFPNPFKNLINIRFNKSVNDNVTVKVINILGEVLYQKEHFANELIENIDIEVQNGIYFIIVEGDKTSVTKKIICTN